MSSILSSVILSKPRMKKNIIFVTAIRNHWLKDYKPGPYPRTKSERMAAADKYGIPYAEYKPYPDDGIGKGDYPALPLISIESRDPFYPWDYPEMKRNFNETLHAEYDLIREDRYDISIRLRTPMWLQVVQCFGALFLCAALYYLAEPVKMFPAVVPRQYPGAGKKHYTFEPNPPPPPPSKKKK